mmetsp:Transcript_37873/g.64663  ORF Transcript_37873/g.64663 Transcript_37873/m.64663 type:complete len:307 (-) Transcript_37873:1040-1960(-)
MPLTPETNTWGIDFGCATSYTSKSTNQIGSSISNSIHLVPSLLHKDTRNIHVRHVLSHTRPHGVVIASLQLKPSSVHGHRITLVRIQAKGHYECRWIKFHYGAHGLFQRGLVLHFPRRARCQWNVKRRTDAFSCTLLVGMSSVPRIFYVRVTVNASEEYGRIFVEDGCGSIATVIVNVEYGHSTIVRCSLFLVITVLLLVYFAIRYDFLASPKVPLKQSSAQRRIIQIAIPPKSIPAGVMTGMRHHRIHHAKPTETGIVDGRTNDGCVLLQFFHESTDNWRDEIGTVIAHGSHDVRGGDFDAIAEG